LEAGAATVGALAVGDAAGSTGSLTIDGAGSKLTSTTVFTGTGLNASGTVTVRNGAQLSSTNNTAFIGGSAGSVGTVTVDGAGSTSNTNGALLEVKIQGAGFGFRRLRYRRQLRSIGADVGNFVRDNQMVGGVDRAMTNHLGIPGPPIRAHQVAEILFSD
jgi:T5SS/PEP-CTERM-associated repeat protein